MSPSVDALNAASERAFIEAMAPLFEGRPAFLAELSRNRPYRDAADLFQRATTIALALPEADQVQLVNAHPRIGALPGAMSAASRAEQGYGAATNPDRDTAAPAGVSPGQLQDRLDRINAAYETRFGFRCVVFVAGRPRSDIVPVMEARLGAERNTELRAAVADVIAIARDRWRTANEDEM